MTHVHEYAFYKGSPRPRFESALRRGAALMVGAVALGGIGLGLKTGVEKISTIEKRYQEQKRRESQPNDMDLVRKYVLESKYRDLRTSKVRLLPRVNGALAIQRSTMPQTEITPTITNFVLVHLPSGSSYIYGEGILKEPIIWNANDAIICTRSPNSVNVESIELGHDSLHGGIKAENTGIFIPNDLNWQEKCRQYIPLESIPLPFAK